MSEGAAAEVAQSERTPQNVKPPIDPRPYAWFAKNDPTIKSWIDEAAEATGVNPHRLAAHKWAESGKSRTSPRGAAGEIGIMQFMPTTWRSVDPDGEYNPADGQKAMMLAGVFINQLDGRYGKDTPASVARYNGSGPKARAYARRILGDSVPDSAFNVGESKVTLKGMMKAAGQGADDALRYVVQATPPNMTMTDKWRNVEAMLVGAFIRKGDMNGAQHARDFVLQMSHAGTNQYLMAAHQALSRGDGVGAAQYLAKSHAFFPDGTMGRFKSDGRNVFAERIDEDDPSRSLGQFPVTADAVAGMLNQTRDPQQYLKTLNEQQKSAAQARMHQLHGDYYAAKPGLDRERMANQAAISEARNESANARAVVRAQSSALDRDARIEAAHIRAGSRNQTSAIDKESAATYDTTMNPDMTPEQAATLSGYYTAARAGGASPAEAKYIASGLSDRTMSLVQLHSGKYGVVKTGDSTRIIGYLPKEYGDKFAPPKQPAQQPTQPVAAPPTALGGAPARVPVDQSSAMPARY